MKSLFCISEQAKLEVYTDLMQLGSEFSHVRAFIEI